MFTRVKSLLVQAKEEVTRSLQNTIDRIEGTSGLSTQSDDDATGAAAVRLGWIYQGYWSDIHKTYRRATEAAAMVDSEAEILAKKTAGIRAAVGALEENLAAMPSLETTIDSLDNQMLALEASLLEMETALDTYNDLTVRQLKDAVRGESLAAVERHRENRYDELVRMNASLDRRVAASKAERAEKEVEELTTRVITEALAERGLEVPSLNTSADHSATAVPVVDGRGLNADDGMRGAENAEADKRAADEDVLEAFLGSASDDDQAEPQSAGEEEAQPQAILDLVDLVGDGKGKDRESDTSRDSDEDVDDDSTDDE